MIKVTKQTRNSIPTDLEPKKLEKKRFVKNLNSNGLIQPGDTATLST